MPLDNFFDFRIRWERKFLFLPKRCIMSKKLMWLTFAFRGVRMITGPGDPIFLYKWINSSDFMLQRLQGKI